jgi:hypothetical protein
MYEKVSSFLDDLSTDMSHGHYAGVSERFFFPAILFVVGKIIVVDTREQLASIARAYGDELERAGMHSRKLKLNAVSLDLEGRHVAHVTGSYFDEAGVALDESRFRYFLREVEGPLKIEMIEMIDFPSLLKDFGAPLLAIAL